MGNFPFFFDWLVWPWPTDNRNCDCVTWKLISVMLLEVMRGVSTNWFVLSSRWIVSFFFFLLVGFTRRSEARATCAAKVPKNVLLSWSQVFIRMLTSLVTIIFWSLFFYFLRVGGGVLRIINNHQTDLWFLHRIRWYSTTTSTVATGNHLTLSNTWYSTLLSIKSAVILYRPPTNKASTAQRVCFLSQICF